MQQQHGSSGNGGPVSVIAHAPATPSGHSSGNVSNTYSISGLLGIPSHHTDPNVSTMKRKRSEDGNNLLTIHAELIIFFKSPAKWQIKVCFTLELFYLELFVLTARKIC